MVKRYKVSNRLVVGDADAFDLQNVHVVLASDHEARCQEINDQWAAENERLRAALRKYADSCPDCLGSNTRYEYPNGVTTQKPCLGIACAALTALETPVKHLGTCVSSRLAHMKHHERTDDCVEWLPMETAAKP